MNEGTEPDEATDRLFEECEPTPRKGELRDIRIGDLQRDADADIAAERTRQVEGMIQQFNAAWKEDLTSGGQASQYGATIQDRPEGRGQTAAHSEDAPPQRRGEADH